MSWRATFEPFRLELPGSTAEWLWIDHVPDEIRALTTQTALAMSIMDYIEDMRPRDPARRVFDKIIRGPTYNDLEVAQAEHWAVSVDRRHRVAIETRLHAAEAHYVDGHRALEFLLPTEFTWRDVPNLRKHRALREYRAILREIESEALLGSSSPKEIDDLIHREYDRRIAAAAAKGVPFGGRVALTVVGFILGVAADSAAPLMGGAASTAGSFAAGEALGRVVRSRWLAVDRLLRGRRNGL